ncbi:uncharacterized protein LOC119161498 isoform X5 [Rhipicephalus microplus]|uniref:uncharacterized protein LOC119161498 isoform X5 n=1 Tax=Rhipicephalus microplus TaxID=6941 RepID=UPI003F6A92E9
MNRLSVLKSTNSQRKAMSSRKQHEEHLVRRGIHDRRSSHHDADLTNPYDEAEDQTDRAENVSTDEEPLKQESDQSLSSDLLPTDWHIGKVNPIFKSGAQAISYGENIS